MKEVITHGNVLLVNVLSAMLTMIGSLKIFNGEIMNSCGIVFLLNLMVIIGELFFMMKKIKLKVNRFGIMFNLNNLTKKDWGLNLNKPIVYCSIIFNVSLMIFLLIR